jgi:hypothetical protein
MLYIVLEMTAAYRNMEDFQQHTVQRILMSHSGYNNKVAFFWWAIVDRLMFKFVDPASRLSSLSGLSRLKSGLGTKKVVTGKSRRLN